MDWQTENKRLCKEFEFENFVAAIAFVNRIVPEAEEMNHHPDIYVHAYKKVKISLFTHSEMQITEKDYLLAKRIDKLFP